MAETFAEMVERFRKLDIPVQLAKVPPQASDSPHGSVDAVVDKGVKEGAGILAGWVSQLLDAVDGLGSVGEINRAINTAELQIDAGKLQGSLERQDLRAQMLGAADADWESTTLEIVPLADFAAGRGGRLVACKLSSFVQRPFGAAVGDFVAKQIVTRKAFDKMTEDARRRAFTVAGTTKKNVVRAVHEELLGALTEGEDLRQFRKRLKERMELRGWLKPGPRAEVPTKPGRPWHVETIYRTNIAGSYARGRRTQMSQPNVVAARPFWQWVSLKADGKSRPTHAAVHGKVLRWDDPAWSRIGPPGGFNCRCRAISRSAADVERLGLEVSSGSVMDALPDPGFSANVTLPLGPLPPAPPPPPPPKPKEPEFLPVEKKAAQLVGTPQEVEYLDFALRQQPTTMDPVLRAIGPVKRLQVAELDESLYGAYSPHSREIKMSRRELRPGTDFARPGTLGKDAWSMSSSAATEDEARLTTLTHELGHHALSASVPSKWKPADIERIHKIQDIVGGRWAEVGADDWMLAKIKGMDPGPMPAVSEYALRCEDEYFAETWTAFHRVPDELKRIDPGGYKMIQDFIEVVQ